MRIEEHLEPGEYVVGYFAPDLDVELRYAQTLVVLTNSRLIRKSGDLRRRRGQQAGRRGRISVLAAGDHRRAAAAHDRAGLGTLELLGPAGELAHWHYTIACVPAAEKFVAALQLLRAGDEEDEEGEEDEEFVWSQAFPGDRAADQVVATSGEVRALPCLGLIILGTVLTLATTSLSLVPTYLTIPIIDDILVPYQDQANAIRTQTADDSEAQTQQLDELSEREVPRLGAKFAWYFSSLRYLAGAALGTWLLAWAQGAVMATVKRTDQRPTCGSRPTTT